MRSADPAGELTMIDRLPTQIFGEEKKEIYRPVGRGVRWVRTYPQTGVKVGRH